MDSSKNIGDFPRKYQLEIASHLDSGVLFLFLYYENILIFVSFMAINVCFYSFYVV